MPFADRIAPMFADLHARRHLGSLVMALDPMRFAGGPTLALTVRELIATLRRQPGDVQYPGEPEERREAVRAREGIPIEPGLWAEFAEWSTRLASVAGGTLKRDVLLVSPIHTGEPGASLEAEYAVHHLWEATEREDLLAAGLLHAPRSS